MPLPQQYNDAIMNLGNIGVKVNLMTQQARILKTQRIQTFEILNRLRELIQKLLNLYNNNKDTLQLVYNDIMTVTKSAGVEQENLLEQLTNELRQSLADPTTEQQFIELKDGVDRLIGEMENVSGPGPGAGAGAGAGAGDGVQNQVPGISEMASRFLNKDGNRGLLDIFNKDGSPGIGGRRRRTKRGGYSWRTPSPNKSRKKTPSYKKTIKKTRTRQN